MGLKLTDLERTHPYYEKRRAQWEWSRDHYLGGMHLAGIAASGGSAVSSGSMPTGYLVKFSAESDESYAARLKRSAGLYDNIVRKALQVYISQLFRAEPQRDLDPTLTELAEDVDLYGTNALPFFMQVSRFTQLYGIYHVLVDATRAVKPEPEGRPFTEREAREQNIRPFFEAISPLNVRNWEVEYRDPSRRGKLNWLVIGDEYTIASRPGAPRVKVKRFRVWTPEEWAELVFAEGRTANEEGHVVSERYGTHTFGEVPLVTFYEEYERPMEAGTLFDDIVLATNSLWQRASAEDEAFQYQAYNLLLFKLASPDQFQVKISASRAILLGVDENAEYLTPSEAPFQAFEAFVARTHERINDLIFARSSRQQPSAQVESAEKRDIDRAEFIALLETKASCAEDGERRCWELASMSLGRAEAKIEIEYSRDFSVEETLTIDWEVQVREGIRSRVEWFFALHPGIELTEDEVKKAIQENLDYEAEIARGRMKLQEEAMRSQFAAQAEALGEGAGPPSDEEGDEQAKEEEDKAPRPGVPLDFRKPPARPRGKRG